MTSVVSATARLHVLVVMGSASLAKLWMFAVYVEVTIKHAQIVRVCLWATKRGMVVAFAVMLMIQCGTRLAAAVMASLRALSFMIPATSVVEMLPTAAGAMVSYFQGLREIFVEFATALPLRTHVSWAAMPLGEIPTSYHTRTFRTEIDSQWVPLC